VQDPTSQAEALAGAAGSVGVVVEAGGEQSPAADAVLESHTHHDDGAPKEAGGEAPADAERRGGRSRDRYGRDRRERGGERAERPAPADIATGAEVSADEQQQAFAPQAESQPADRGQREQRAQREERPQRAERQDRAPREERQRDPGRDRAPEAAAAAPVAAAPASGLPRVQPFQLPVEDLKGVAEGSGLQWVLSDAEKIAAAQAAAAAEPQPVRVPRERPPAVTLDDGPLVLVETKRDLRNMQLPF
jgi:ribonuclease E